MSGAHAPGAHTPQVDFIDINMMKAFERAGLTWTDGMTPMMEAVDQVARRAEGLAQYDRPVISRIWSLDYPEEIRPGMVFALETQHGKVHEFGVRLEEMLLVNDTGYELLSTYQSHDIITVD